MNFHIGVKLIVGVSKEFLLIEEWFVADSAAVESDVGRLQRDLLPEIGFLKLV